MKAFVGDVIDPDVATKKPRIYKKCEHNKRPHICRQCFPNNFCQHNRRRSACVECQQQRMALLHTKRSMETGEDSGLESSNALFGEVSSPDIATKKPRIIKKCEHDIRPHDCRQCFPDRFCQHNRRCSTCVVCQEQRIALVHTKRSMETQEDGSLESSNALFGDVSDLDIVAKKKYIRKKCEHDKRKTDCKECSAGNFCIHNKTLRQCPICTPSCACEHSSRRNMCKICSPNILCPHNYRYQSCRICSPDKFCTHNLAIKGCKICSPCKFCPHNLQVTRCKICSPHVICQHGIWKSGCKKCTLSIVCQHGSLSSYCVICCPHLVCQHGGRKKACKLCTPGLLCRHGGYLSSCRLCKPSLVCKHDKIRYSCRDCLGSGFCECLKLKVYCSKHGGSGLCIECQLVPHNKKYNKHCIDCFVNAFPGDPRSSPHGKLKRRETVVREAIDEIFEGFIHDKAYYVGGKCCPHRRRVDHRFSLGNTVLAVETDEDAHISKDKQDEINRYDDLVMAMGHKMVFIRFNPDTNREELGAKTNLDHKIEALLICIGTQIERIRNNENTELCEIVWLFYCKACSKNGSDICLCPAPQ